MKRPQSLRLISVCLAVITAFSSVAGSACTVSVNAAAVRSDVSSAASASAESNASAASASTQSSTSSADSAGELSSEEVMASVEQQLSAQLGQEVELVPETDTSGVAADVQTQTQEDAAGTSDPQTTAKEDSDPQAAEAESSDSAGTGDDALITDITKGEDGTVTATDKYGTTATVNTQTGDTEVDLSGTDAQMQLEYNAADALNSPTEDAEYLGSDSESGFAMYRSQVNYEDIDWESEEAEEQELQRMIDWMETPALSGDTLSQALQAAADWNTEVLQNCYEPVYEDEPVAAMALEEEEDNTEAIDEEETDEEIDKTADDGTEENGGEETEEEADKETDGDTEASETPELIGYELKEEYAEAEPEATDLVSFCEAAAPGADEAGVSAAAASLDDGIMSISDEGTEDTDAKDTSWVSTTVYFVDESALLIHVVDEEGKGINGASVYVQTQEESPQTWETVTKSLTDGSADSDGMALLELGDAGQVYSLLITIDHPDYCGVTSAEIIEGGGELTYTLRERTQGEVYVRGITLDGTDIYNNPQDLCVQKENTSVSEISVYVEIKGNGPAQLPGAGQLELCSDGVSVNGLADLITCADVTSDDGTGYRVYTFRGQWNGYSGSSPRLKVGKTVSVRWAEGTKTTWAESTAEDKKTVNTQLNITAPLMEDKSGTTIFRWISTKDTSRLGIILPDGSPLAGTVIEGPLALMSLPVDVLYDTAAGTVTIAGHFGWNSDDTAANLWSSLKQAKNSNCSLGQYLKSRFAMSTYGDYIKKTIGDFGENYYDMKKVNTAIGQIAYGGKGSWSVDIGLYLVLKLNTKEGGVYGVDGFVRFTGAAGYTFTSYYLIPGLLIPAYFGFNLKGEFMVSARIYGKTNGVALSVFDIATEEDGIEDYDTLSIMISVVLSAYLGVGFRGLFSGELSGAVGIYDRLDLLSNFRNRVYWGYSLRLSFKSFLFNFSWPFSGKMEKLSDTRLDLLDDPSDQKPTLPGGYVPLPVSLDDEDLALSEKLEVADDEESAAEGMYTSCVDPDASEDITIDSDGTQTEKRSYAQSTNATVDANSTEHVVLEGVASSDTMEYIPGMFIRIANVKDEQYFSGETVPRVTITKTSTEGLGETIALPATQDGYGGKYYGYDYNFSVYEGDKYYFFIISSSCVAPEGQTVSELAGANRLRVVLLDKTDLSVHSQRVLYKYSAGEQGQNYFYVGTPSIASDYLGEEAYKAGVAPRKVKEQYQQYQQAHDYGEDFAQSLLNDFGAQYLNQTGYYVACGIATNLSAFTTGTGEEETDLGYGLYLARGGDYVDAWSSCADGKIIMDGIEREKLLFVTMHQYNPVLLSTEAQNDQVLEAISLCSVSDPYTLTASERQNFDMGGSLHNLQEVTYEQTYDGNVMERDLYATVNGELCRIEISNSEENVISMEKTMLGVTSDTGETFSMDAEGLKLLRQDQYLFALRGMNVSDVGDDGELTYGTKLELFVIENAVWTNGTKTDDNEPVIYGPFTYTINNRQAYNAVAAFEEGGIFLLRTLYLADEEQKLVSVAQNTSEDPDKNVPAAVSTISNLYMWEMVGGGLAVELNSIEPSSTRIRKKDKTFSLDLNMTNINTYTANSVELCITDDKEDESHYKYYTITIKDGLKPFQTKTVSANIDIDESWTGETTLYAKLTKVNGTDMMEGFTPKWVEQDALLGNGDFSLSVEEKGDSTAPYANVTIRNYSTRSFKDVALRMEVNRSADVSDDTWEEYLQYDFDEMVNDGATAANANSSVMTVRIPLKELWKADNADGFVYAVRFTLVGQNDITLNNIYTISGVLYNRESPVRYVTVAAETADKTMGTVQVADTEATGSADEDTAGVYVKEGTKVTVSAEAKDGFVLDHWEIRDVLDPAVWYRMSDTSGTLEMSAGEELAGTDYTIPEGSDYVLRAYFRAADDRTRVNVVALEKVTETDAEGTSTVTYQYNTSLPQTGITLADGTSVDTIAADSPVPDADAYMLKGGQTLCLTPPDSENASDGAWTDAWTDDWVFRGFCLYTYDADSGSFTLAGDIERPFDQESNRLLKSITQEAGTTDIYVAMIYEENTNPPIRVRVDYNGGTLAVDNTDWHLLEPGDRKVGRNVSLGEHLPGEKELTYRYGTLNGYNVTSHETDAAGTGGWKFLTLEEVKSYSGYQDGDVIMASYAPKAMVAVSANVDDWGSVSYTKPEDSDTYEDENGLIVTDAGTKLVFTATPREGYRFVKWQLREGATGDYKTIENAGEEYTYQAKEGVYYLQAVFEAVYTLTVYGGTIADETSGDAAGGSSSEGDFAENPIRREYACGESVTVRLAEEEDETEGKAFEKWYVDGPEEFTKNLTEDQLKAKTLTFTMPVGDVVVMALYEGTKYTIQASAGENGTITPSGKVPVSEGEDITFTMTPKDGYQIDTVTVDGKQVSLNQEETLTDSTAPAGNAAGTDDTAADAAASNGETASNGAAGTGTYTFQDVEGDHSIQVTFKKETATLVVRNEVTGELGDRARSFEFTLCYADEAGDSRTETFSLVHGGSATWKDIPIGSTLTVTQTASDGYTTSYVTACDGTADASADGCEVSLEVGKGTTTITFTNDKKANMDTGVELGSLPYVLLLVIAAAGGAAMAVRRRREQENRE